MKTIKTIGVLVSVIIISVALNVYLWLNKSTVSINTSNRPPTEQTVNHQTPVFTTIDKVHRIHKKDKLHGVDLSHWNGEVHWPVLKRSDISFIYMKATQGIRYVDPQFEHNWVSAKNYGFHRGAYHFYQPGQDPKAQAEHFMAHVKFEKGDLIPVLDIEIAHGEDPEKLTEGVRIWVNTIKEVLGRYPMIYTDTYFWNKFIKKEFSECPLWFAEWGVSKPRHLPKGWNEWVFWQYTESGSVKGIPSKHKTDLDWFNGDIQNLKKYAIK